MGGSWVVPEDGSMALYHSETDIEGPVAFNQQLPLPELPAAVPRDNEGRPLFLQDVAVLAVPAETRQKAHEFIFNLPGFQRIDHVVLYNTNNDDPAISSQMFSAAKDFEVAVSTSDTRESAFRTILRASLNAGTEAQRFDFQPVDAKYLRFRLLNGHNPGSEQLSLAEFEAYAVGGRNVAAANIVDRTQDSSELYWFSTEFGSDNRWRAGNIHDGVKAGAEGSWMSAGSLPLLIRDAGSIVDLTNSLGADGRLGWPVPDGKWQIMRFVCANTGERLKVPSPASDGLATDHFSADVTRRFIDYLLQRLSGRMGDLRESALEQLYLPSYEVRGAVWTPDFTDQFRRYRKYDMTRYLPILANHRLADDEFTQRFLYDYRKTQGELLVDAYYRTASETVHEQGLGIEAESGGPGPPVHNVPVDALEALGAIDEMRGEFWPKRPERGQLWVVKETACAAHIYGRKRVHMEAFTSFHHWQDGPFDLKDSADRAFCEGANHFVWHTSSHIPPEAGKPGWVYHAGTHINPSLVWWDMAKPFIDYQARCSFMLQQGLFVADVCYYYGDQGYNFVPPKHIDPSLGYGYDYDVCNKDVLLNRMSVRDGRIVLPDGMSYEILVLPDREDIDLDVLKRVEELARAGATVIGPKPTRSNGLTDYPNRDAEVSRIAETLWSDCDGEIVREHDYQNGRIICGKSLREVLLERGVTPDFEFTSSDRTAEIDYVHRHDNGTDIYFLRNKQNKEVVIDASFRVTGKRPEIWLPDTGTFSAMPMYQPHQNSTELRLKLVPFGSVFVVFRERADQNYVVSVSTEAPAGSELTMRQAEGLEIISMSGNQTSARVFANGAYRIVASNERAAHIEVNNLPNARALDGDWRVRFAPGLGAPAEVTFDELKPWNEHELDGIRYFSGKASYHKKFDVQSKWQKNQHELFLDLGDLWAVAEVQVNGRQAGILWKPPYVVDVTELVKPGMNDLVVTIANTWSNRLVGDARNPDGERFTRTNIEESGGKPWSEVELLESGLFGPVRLVPALIQTADWSLPAPNEL
jgi:hypothetical protein